MEPKNYVYTATMISENLLSGAKYKLSIFLATSKAFFFASTADIVTPVLSHAPPRDIVHC